MYFIDNSFDYWKKWLIFVSKSYHMKKPAQIDIAVLMLFFNRPETFQLVFNEVRKARPSRLFLYQDGPRDERDLPGIMACRKIVEDIDWECDVRRNYQEQNQGCDPSGYLSHKWAFSLADKCMVLEDDVVPSQSFFPFCKELLDKYEHDDRVAMISGFNVDEVTPGVPDDYFFTSTFSIWGWASWKRVLDQWDGEYQFMKDAYTVRQLRALQKRRAYRRDMMKMFTDHSRSGKPYFETVFWASMLLHSQLSIMPTRNLVNNVGLTAGSTHFSANLKTMPHRLRRIFTMKRYELDFPLHHPKYMVDHVEYQDHYYKTIGWNHRWIKVCNSMEELFLNLRRGNFRQIARSFRRRCLKWMGMDTYQ